MIARSMEMVEGLSRSKYEKLQEALQGLPVELEFEQTVHNGEPVCLIQIQDPSISMTTIRCNAKGYNIHWGSSTPSDLKSLISDTMRGEVSEDDILSEWDDQWDEFIEDYKSKILNAVKKEEILELLDSEYDSVQGIYQRLYQIADWISNEQGIIFSNIDLSELNESVIPSNFKYSEDESMFIHHYEDGTYITITTDKLDIGTLIQYHAKQTKKYNVHLVVEVNSLNTENVKFEVLLNQSPVA